MNKRMLVPASIAVSMLAASCGGDGSSTNSETFSDQLASVCRTIDRGIGGLDDATSLGEIRGNASDASALYEDGLNELKKLKIPTNDRAFEADVKDLIASFEDQLDTLDAIAKAAKESDQEAVDTRISTLTDQAAESNDLADSIDISRCQIDAVFDATPATTEPVPLTLPIVTVPDDTVPLDTFPIDTTPTESNKVVVSSSDMVPLGDYTFSDPPVDATDGFHELVDLSPLLAAQSGRITGVDVLDLNGQPMGRVFAFESDVDPLPPGSLEEVTPFLTGDIPTTPLTVGTQSGVSWSDPDGTSYFLLGTNNVLLWALSPTADLLVPALQAWGESISQ
ncbi:MAG: hypothetical protein ABI894_11280 [Ilumatobacteraceae bacterium]